MLVEGTAGENLDPLIRVSMDDVQFFLRIFMRGTAQCWSLGHGMNFAGEKRPWEICFYRREGVARGVA